MGQASLKAQFCKASELKRGMQILSWNGRLRFMRIKKITYVDNQVIVKMGSIQVTYMPNHEVHVLKQ